MTSALSTTQLPDFGGVSANAKRLIDFSSLELTNGGANEDDYFVLNNPLAKELEAQRLVVRPCYIHMLPIIEAQLESREESRVCVTGTPGIGKTLFGVVLFRHLVEQGRSVLYWGSKYATLFSASPDIIKPYGLKNACTIQGNNSWRWGTWLYETNLDDLLISNDVYVVHDPREEFIDGGRWNGTVKLVTILSYGHRLIDFWNTKGHGRPDLSLTMPVFAYDEIKDNKNNLFAGKSITDTDISNLYKKFGGCLRFMMDEKMIADFWGALEGKVQDVVSDGKGIAVRTKSHRGTIVHVATDFDKSRPLFNQPGHNTFKDQGFILGSTEILEEFQKKLSTKGRLELTQFMNNIKGEKGSEVLYGVLFEQFAHSMLQEEGKKFNIRVVHNDNRKNSSHYATIELPRIESIQRFGGHEASCITEQLKKLEVGSYISPMSSNFPTYDAALVVPASCVGVSDYQYVALLLQMTVSGATGIRRRPKHVVKQYMRTEMNTALVSSIGELTAPNTLSVTTFCVPTECFHPFLFQPEEVKDSETLAKKQADFQFVIEIPEFSELPKVDAEVDVIHAVSEQCHRYMLRKRSFSRVETSAIYQDEENEEEDGVEMDETKEG